MGLSRDACCVWNSGSGAWAFEPVAKRLSAELGIDVSSTPRRFNYVLGTERDELPVGSSSFIPLDAIQVAGDKRLLARRFLEAGVRTPSTFLFDSFDAVLDLVTSESEREWCLKYPIGCGGAGHRLILAGSDEPRDWPRPFVVQEFVRLERPAVFRTYCAGGELFGWVVRSYPETGGGSPWVAHARGAVYTCLDDGIPSSAADTAGPALRAAGLWESFGCADLICRPDGEWLVLEVGTDGVFNHVDREIGASAFEAELYRRISGAFWKGGELEVEG